MSERDRGANRERANRWGRGPGRPGGQRPGRGRGRQAGGREVSRGEPTAGHLSIRPLGEGAFELAHPPGVEEVRLDYEEAMEVWRAGEPDEAREILRYALEGFHENLWIHAALGRIALQEDRNPTLARGHFGYVYELAMRALPSHFTGRLPPDRAANQPLYEALDGLIACNDALGRQAESDELRRRRAQLSGALRDRLRRKTTRAKRLRGISAEAS